MPRYYAANHVPDDVLRNIVIGGYEMQLSAEESALLERVPLSIKPWFERVVVNEFYLPLRGVMKPPVKTLAGLIDEILPPEAIQEQGSDGKRKRPTLRGSFEYGKEHGRFSHLTNHTQNAAFEGLVETALFDYRRSVVNVIQASLSSNFPFKCVSPHEVIDSVASRMR